MLRRLKTNSYTKLSMGRKICISLVCCLFVACGSMQNLFPYRWKVNIDREKFNEPSGICYHSKRKTLFVVGDEGDICEMATNGKLINQKHIDPASSSVVKLSDFEGITSNPLTGLLYVAVESAETILEFNPDTLEATREFILPRELDGKTLMKAGRQGIEAITFVPDSNHPEGGTFYVANQSFSLESEDDISGIFEFELAINTSSEKTSTAKMRRYFKLEIIDVSGLHYEKESDLLYVISDETNSMSIYSKDGELLKVQELLGKHQEGVAMDNDDYMYVAQDSGGIIKIKWDK